MIRTFLLLFLFSLLPLTLTAQRKQSTSKQTTTRTTSKKTTKKKAKTKQAATTSIKGLQNQRAAVQKKIRQQEQALKANKADVSRRLKDLMVINSEISQQQRSIDDITRDITHLDGNIQLLTSQLAMLERQLDECRQRYVRSVRYMARHHTVQDRLMFVFSAQSLTQMYRRMRFARQYATYQRAQGEMLQDKQQQVSHKQQQLQQARGSKDRLLQQSVQARTQLETKQTEQQNAVKGLQRQQKTIQSIIAEQRRKSESLNSLIDRLVAEEEAKARARAEAEAKRKAAAAAAAKRKAEELARRKAEARENARRVAAAREAEARTRAAADEAARTQGSQAAARAEQAAREARAAREAAERKAAADKERSSRQIAAARQRADEATRMSSADRMLSGGFEANKGRLPMPMSGRVVSHYGQYAVEGLKGVTLDNKGINILGQPGAAVRSIYDGEVSAVYHWQGSIFVMVRHGGYISFYCNLGSVCVSKGQRVSTRQTLGTVGPDQVLQFQLRRGSSRLNPEAWLAR